MKYLIKQSRAVRRVTCTLQTGKDAKILGAKPLYSVFKSLQQGLVGLQVFPGKVRSRDTILGVLVGS